MPSLGYLVLVERARAGSIDVLMLFKCNLIVRKSSSFQESGVVKVCSGGLVVRSLLRFNTSTYSRHCIID